MININRETLTETIVELVRIPSINPSLVSGANGEREIAEAIAARLRRTPGITVELQDSGEGRPNVIAAVGDGGGRTLMLNGHMDTVGVAGMEDPFSARVEGNRLYGRGAADMKAALASAIVLLEGVARAGDFPGRLVVTFVTDEEHSSIGTGAVCREIDRWKPDAAIVMEGSGLTITIAHKGFAWGQITTRGFAAHGSDWKTGIDAIAHMGRVLVSIEGYREFLTDHRDPHALLGPPSVHASLIRGGQELSSYPDRCELEFERRTIPGETEQQVQHDFQVILDRLADADAQFEAELTMGLFREPFEISRDEAIVQTLAQVCRAETGNEPEYTGGSGWMDSALLAGAGIPVVIFGPEGGGAHGMVEWVNLNSVQTFTHILAKTAYDFCGTSTE